ncbi:MAG: FAD-binding oxidoreductase [Rubrivivax sp.]|nr:FAD-binding oxidoreductase [Rubrivivax sp.]
MTNPDVVVIGAGVIGCSVAWHLATLGAGRVLVLERGQIGNGTSAMSSGILRTHYSVPQNVDLALRSWRFFERFAEHLDDPEASAGLVRCGYLIAVPEGDKVAPLRESLAAQAARGIAVELLDARAAREKLPIARFDDAALIGHEPDAGFADATLTATSFARAARRRGVVYREGVAATGLAIEGGRVRGVLTHDSGAGVGGRIDAGMVVSAQNIWAHELTKWTGLPVPLVAERHRVLALAGPAPYTRAMPVFKDLGSPGMLYGRSYGGTQMLVSEGTAGEVLATPDTTQGEVSMDLVAHIGEQVAARFPGWEEAALASSWTGVYDVTPDWNPVLGPVPGLDGLIVAFGFSGHGFKLSPAVGRVLAQAALGLPTDVPLAPYALERFAKGRMLSGRYGAGAVS